MSAESYDLEFVNEFLNHSGRSDPPGVESVFADHPIQGKKEAVEIAYMFQHRFAFHYWAKWRNETSIAPNLITVDWHNDVGGECDFDKEKIASYDFSHNEFSSLFAWAALRPLNDGHIAPAQYLGMVNDVFVLRKQRPQDNDHESSRHQVNTNIDGNETHTWHFWSEESLTSALKKNSDSQVYFDLDLDFFVEKEETDGCDLVSDAKVNAFLDPNSELMQFVFERLTGGITIALEPTYCGGFHNCTYLLNKLNDKWFREHKGCYSWNHFDQ